MAIAAPIAWSVSGALDLSRCATIRLSSARKGVPREINKAGPVGGGRSGSRLET